MKYNLFNKGVMLVISSPSGVGKTTIANLLISKKENFLVRSISVTTRYKRPKEEEGVDYFFSSEEEFLRACDSGDMLEYAKVFENYYGTPRRFIENNLNKGINILLNIDWQGAFHLMEVMKNHVVSIFILPPSMKELERRIMSRGSDDYYSIKKRLDQAAFEMSHCYKYDYIIINRSVKESVEQVSCILKTESYKVKRQTNLSDFINQVVSG